MKFFERRTARWWAFSVAAHIVLVAAFAQIAFRYPLGQLLGIAPPPVKPERLQYIALPTPPTENSGGGRLAAEKSAPAALRAPITTPAKVPVQTPIDSSRAQAAGGRGTGLGADWSGLANGIMPRQPDPRIALAPNTLIRSPRTVSEDVDSIMNLAIGIYVDSVKAASTQRKPGDWTVKGKDGKVWGVDANNIYLGKYKLPSAILALLPLNKAGGGSPIEARSAAFIRRDIMENAQRSVTEDEFRTAVKRIRERKEREKRQLLASDSKEELPKQQ